MRPAKSSNNNAVIVPSDKDLADAGCSSAVGKNADRSLTSAQVEKLLERKMDLIEDTVNSSLNNLQEYIDQKLSSLS